MNTKKIPLRFNYKDYYERDAGRVDMTDLEETRRYKDSRRFQTISDLFPVRLGLTVLDVGCGDGVFLVYGELRGFNMTGLEISTTRVKRAKQLLRSKGIYADVVVGDVNKIPFNDGVFDVVVASEVIEHVPDPLAAVSEMKRVVKSGGSVVAAVPYKEKIIYDQCIHCGKFTPRNGHLHSFDVPKIIELLKSVGLKDMSYYRCVSLRTPFWGRVGKKLPYFVWKILDRFFTRLGDEANWVIARGKV